MIGLNELFAKRAKYENEKVYLDAKIAVVDEFIADEQAKCIEQPETVAEEVAEDVAEEENTEEETLVDQDAE